MSLLRPRAIQGGAEATRSARRPWLTRARLVRVMSSCSSAELKLLVDQARVGFGVAKSPTAVRAKATTTIATHRETTFGLDRTTFTLRAMAEGGLPSISASGCNRA